MFCKSLLIAQLQSITITAHTIQPSDCSSSVQAPSTDYLRCSIVSNRSHIPFELTSGVGSVIYWEGHVMRCNQKEEMEVACITAGIIQRPTEWD